MSLLTINNTKLISNGEMKKYTSPTTGLKWASLSSLLSSLWENSSNYHSRTEDILSALEIWWRLPLLFWYFTLCLLCLTSGHQTRVWDHPPAELGQSSLALEVIQGSQLTSACSAKLASTLQSFSHGSLLSWLLLGCDSSSYFNIQMVLRMKMVMK